MEQARATVNLNRSVQEPLSGVKDSPATRALEPCSAARRSDECPGAASSCLKVYEACRPEGVSTISSFYADPLVQLVSAPILHSLQRAAAAKLSRSRFSTVANVSDSEYQSWPRPATVLNNKINTCAVHRARLQGTGWGTRGTRCRRRTPESRYRSAEDRGESPVRNQEDEHQEK